MEDKILWVYNFEKFEKSVTVELIFGEYEDRALSLLETLQDTDKQPIDIIKTVFSDFDESKHIVRLGQEIDRSSGIPVRFIQIFEVVKN